ncbi:unnamed protein product [Vitrella brassicaformis CCMP3155]|uniref:Uncharacterized protein n=1 Tax=Vitrella brassicaformis (strain CCMP3155) TaxID=1169540 RepID=A0A0G4H6P8_VITBC|nr:unnamed protein product [Vitrella brassicaformis CCMP3155]|eukprot:CEM39516.1 unnamed protein product [Vitrella brassicaformis CCMP3155]
MELHQWLKALKELPREVHAAMESGNPSPMVLLTTHILKPLYDATVAKDHTTGTAKVKAINTDPLVKELLASIRPRVKQLFTHNARGGHSLPLSGFQQLCADFDVSELLAPVTIQRTYWSPVSAGNEEDRKIEANELSFTAFQLAVVTLASKAPGPEFTDSEKSQCVSAAHEHFKIAPHLAPAAYASETLIEGKPGQTNGTRETSRTDRLLCPLIIYLLRRLCRSVIHQLVLTKVDLLKPMDLHSLMMRVVVALQQLPLELVWPFVHAVSAREHLGVADLRCSLSAIASDHRRAAGRQLVKKGEG